MTPLLTVIIPVYNEARTIDELLYRVLDTRLPKQIIVVDDGSTDETPSKLEAWPVTVVRHPANRGKGAAIRSGLQKAEGTYTIIQDADLEYDPEDYRRLLEPLLAGEADVVYGSRYLKESQVPRPKSQVAESGAGSGDLCTTGAGAGEAHTSGGRLTEINEANEIAANISRSEMATMRSASLPSRSPVQWNRWSLCRLGVVLLNRLVKWFYGAQITDEATCYKVFRTDDLRAMDLQCERFEFCPEVTAKACRMGLRIVEVPISYTPRSVAQGKKVRWRDGWSAVKTLWRWRNWRPRAISWDFQSAQPSRSAVVEHRRQPAAHSG